MDGWGASSSRRSWAHGRLSHSWRTVPYIALRSWDEHIDRASVGVEERRADPHAVLRSRGATQQARDRLGDSLAWLARSHGGVPFRYGNGFLYLGVGSSGSRIGWTLSRRSKLQVSTSLPSIRAIVSRP